MLDISNVLKRERTMKALVGLGSKEFHDILLQFNKQLEENEIARRSEQQRQRAPGGGAKAFLIEPRMKLLFILVYFRVYPTQDLLAAIFGMSQPNAHKWIHRLTPIIQATLGYEMVLPQRAAISSFPELIQKYPDLMMIIDATERPINRPTSSDRQKKLYSGKKKRHTLKNTVISMASDKRVVFLGQTREGKIHDKHLAEEDDLHFPENTILFADLGYPGFGPPGATLFMPKKKPRNNVLRESEKEYNRAISSMRVGVEHSIGGIKFFRICHDIYRNRKEGFDDLSMEICCGLYNYHIDHRIGRVDGTAGVG